MPCIPGFLRCFDNTTVHNRKMILIKCAMTEQLMRRGALSVVTFARRYNCIYMSSNYKLLKIINFMKYICTLISSLSPFFKLQLMDRNDATTNCIENIDMIPISFHLLLLDRRLLARVMSSHAEARKVTAIQTCQNLCFILCLSNRIQMI